MVRRFYQIGQTNWAREISIWSSESPSLNDSHNWPSERIEEASWHHRLYGSSLPISFLSTVWIVYFLVLIDQSSTQGPIYPNLSFDTQRLEWSLSTKYFLDYCNIDLPLSLSAPGFATFALGRKTSGPWYKLPICNCFGVWIGVFRDWVIELDGMHWFDVGWRGLYVYCFTL